MKLFRLAAVVSALILLTLPFSGCDSAPKAYSFPEVSELTEQKELPDPLLLPDGRKVTKPGQYAEQVRYVREMLAHYMYGAAPARPAVEDIEVVSEKTSDVYGGAGKMHELTLLWGDGNYKMNVRIVYPADGKRHPVILRLDYLCDQQYAFPQEEALVRDGRYAFIVVGRRDLAPDNPADTANFTKQNLSCGAIALWGYGASVALDYAEEKYDFVEEGKVAVTGHSRDGKAALYAGLYDERFTVINPNGSGLCGSGSFRIKNEGSEALSDILAAFPNWFSADFKAFAGKDRYLPFDMNLAIAALAPRGFISTQASQDWWANPDGTYANVESAKKVYELFGAADRISYHMRDGEHNQTAEDVDALIEFCDMCFAR